MPMSNLIRDTTLGTKLEMRLERLAQRTGRSKSLYIRRAVKEYLDEKEDYLIAAQRLEENLPSIPLEKVLDDLNPRRQARPRGGR
jgi:RHH-type transcriptional regulator, rel operon repressor / antitoxin RelB